MKRPKISLIVPVYNVSKTIVKCLSSIENQTFDDFEVIIVDDGSTDNSGDLCRRFVEKDKRFFLIEKGNEGVSSARNVAIKKAFGHYIGFVDSDDYIDKHFCEILFKIITENNVDVLNFGYTRIDGERKVVSYSSFPKNRIIREPEILDFMETSMLNNDLWYPWRNFVKREFIEKNFIRFDENQRIGDDSLFNLKCFVFSKSFYSIKEPLYFYVNNPISLTQAKFKPGLLAQYEMQFRARLAFHKEHEVLKSEGFYRGISTNYIEHSLFMMLENLKNSETGMGRVEINEIRESEIFDFSFNHYTSSGRVTMKMRIIILLFKLRLFRMLTLVYNFSLLPEKTLFLKKD
ncbi:glycosyltransferase [Marinilabilia sp.]|uniref:glycosyltransferase family 2 protein n=1 Tax=Marinilabilia sp. TaxID=2021252 RepID=UPI0025BCA7A6|nr:glycosyltransferase [Marinilabilia sp.]